jgi:hypothetical protein
MDERDTRIVHCESIIAQVASERIWYVAAEMVIAVRGAGLKRMVVFFFNKLMWT